MDFFKSVFSDEPKNPDPNPPQNLDPSPTDGGGDAGWSFGGLMKTLSTKSESVIETYRRDLKEFGAGLRKEVETAHSSLETVGHAIDEIGSSVVKGTARIISHGKDAILGVDLESHLSDHSKDSDKNSQSRGLGSKRYSRFNAQVRAMEGDAGTYCEEPEDAEDYKKWREGFVLEEKREEMGSLLEANGVVESVHKRVVPGSVDEETFWCRYFYRVYKLKQAEDLRASFVRRAITSEEEDLSWDVDDDDEEKEEEEEKKIENLKVNSEKNENLGSGGLADIIRREKESNDESKEDSGKVNEKIGSSQEIEQSSNAKEGISVAKEGISVKDSKGEERELEKTKEESASKTDKKGGLEVKGDNGGSSKDSEFSVVSSHASTPEDEDLGWDEIEDMSNIDEKKVVTRSGSPNKIDLRKRLSAAEEEDLSWDIEDEDDEHVKA